MPSAKILSEKQAYVADLKAKFESAVSGCVVAYGGINVENDTKLRKELREAGVDYMVVKNTMLRLAVKGTSLEGLAENFKGDTAVAFAHEKTPRRVSPRVRRPGRFIGPDSMPPRRLRPRKDSRPATVAAHSDNAMPRRISMFTVFPIYPAP